MAYRLYLNDFYTIDRYEYFSKLSKNARLRYALDIATPIKFSLSGKIKDSFKIEEIDALLCGFKDEEEFVEELKIHNLSYLTKKEQNNSHITLTHRHNGRVKKVPIIFDDQLLYRQAMSLRKNKKALSYRKEKNESKDDSRVLTENSQELNDYIYYIKSLAINSTTRQFILAPEKIPYLSTNDLIELDTDIFHDRYNKEQSFKKEGLRSLLERYLRYQGLYDELLKKGDSTLEIENELNKINKKINLFFRSDYRNLRKIIEWEQTYKKVLSSCLKKDNINNEQKEIIQIQIDKLSAVKEMRNSKYTNFDLLFLDEKEIYNIQHMDRENNNNFFDSDRIAELYKEGGIGNVMENMDLDEILSYRNDAEKLGILPKTKK